MAGDRSVKRRISVFVFDRRYTSRRKLRDMLAAEPGIAVAGEAATAVSALAQIGELHPDVAVVDAQLPDGGSAYLPGAIRGVAPATACLVLLAAADEKEEAVFLMAGAAGCVAPRSDGDLADAVRTVAAGLSTLDADTARMMFAHSAPGPAGSRAAGLGALTAQELRVLRLIGGGLTNRLIAERMSLSEKTVKNYVRSLLSKLGMHRRAQAAALAARAGLVADGAVVPAQGRSARAELPR